MEQADVAGIQLEYEATGAGDPVLLIHGAFVADSFHPLLVEPKLAGAYQLITYRGRGYGGSGRTIDRSPVSAERQAADCAGLLRWLDLQRAHIVGHSFGGCLALQLALDSSHPTCACPGFAGASPVRQSKRPVLSQVPTAQS